MSARELARLTALLGRLARAGNVSAPVDSVEERVDLRAQGGKYDLYLPRGKRRGVLVALHGVTPAGKSDRRLVAFARTLARSEIACIVPELPQLCLGHTDPHDLCQLEEIIVTASQRLGSKVALMGFSYGASYCLVAAARPRIADSVSFVLSVGAYHNLDDLVEYFRALSKRGPRDANEWNELIYLNCLLASHQPELLAAPSEELPLIQEWLLRYCDGDQLAAKKAFYLERLQTQRIVERYHWQGNSPASAACSPRGQLAALRCPVGILHDRQDAIVPASHAHRISEELSAAGIECQLLISSMLSHVSVANVFKLRELRSIYRLMAPLARGW